MRSVSSALLLLLFASLNRAAPATAPAEVGTFAAPIKPLLTTYCVSCHNADRQEGGVNFAALAEEKQALAKRLLWKRARRRIATGEMPPAEARQLPQAEKQQLVRWMAWAAEHVDCDLARRDPGPAPLRRLNRTEYNNTLRDLLGLPFDAASAVGLPEEEPGEGHFDNLAAQLSLSPVLLDKYFNAADKVLDRLFTPGYPGEAARRRLLTAKPGPRLSERDAARAILTPLLRRAYRKPVREDDLNRLLGFVDRALARGESFENAIRAALKPVLVSPQFLLRIEEDRSGPDGSAGVAVDDHELAVRLSYFLWSTMPDEELFRLADQKKLSEPAVLEQQVRRLLADSRARALTDNFAVQWLQLKKLAHARPSTEFFPTFRGPLKQAMFDEATLFFDQLRKEDRSILELLDADYTFANDVLANHYGIEGVTAREMKKVPLKPEQHRGGLLGMAAVLTLTSHTFRTSPTQRGKYVLEVIFGTPPPPPPANVGMLKDDAPGARKQPLTFKEQLAQHAAQPSCAGCHRKIDPLGFALENYNAIGVWRESTQDNRLEVTGVLPTGEKLNGVGDLKKVILARKDEFARTLAEKFLIYALGRELDSPDECSVRDAIAGLKKNDYRLSALVLEIVRSVPFRQRRPALR